MNGEIFQGVGWRLAEARQAKGLSTADVAARLKLSVRQIEALEVGDLAQLPGEIFVRGYIRNYARLLELDPVEFLPRVEAQATEQLTVPSTNLRFQSSPVGRWAMIAVTAVVLLFGLVALLYAWLNRGQTQTLTSMPTEAQPAPPQPPTAAAPAPAAPPPADEPAVSPAAPAVAPTAAESYPAPAAPVQAEPAASSAGGLLFQPGEDSWVQVVDAEGRRFAKLILAGQSEAFEGTPPYRIVVGNASTMRLSFRGSVVDLKPHTDRQIARLTLGEASAASPRSQPAAPAKGAGAEVTMKTGATHP